MKKYKNRPQTKQAITSVQYINAFPRPVLIQAEEAYMMQAEQITIML